ncbi:MAG: DUF1540 domain-containing protein [Clostridia bacterium]|nr:DUF1540 domain-containing protein [Clostridia bacterium]MEE1055205.1 DUF1540 domain-containing protein [Acutalibacteraceae bacterium]
MTDHAKETQACIDCTVKNCVYHTENDACSAGKIKVGNGSASCVGDTCCDTFRAK